MFSSSLNIGMTSETEGRGRMAHLGTASLPGQPPQAAELHGKAAGVGSSRQEGAGGMEGDFGPSFPFDRQLEAALGSPRQLDRRDRFAVDRDDHRVGRE